MRAGRGETEGGRRERHRREGDGSAREGGPTEVSNSEREERGAVGARHDSRR